MVFKNLFLDCRHWQMHLGRQLEVGSHDGASYKQNSIVVCLSLGVGFWILTSVLVLNALSLCIWLIISVFVCYNLEMSSVFNVYFQVAVTANYNVCHTMCFKFFLIFCSFCSHLSYHSQEDQDCIIQLDKVNDPCNQME